MFKTKQIQKFNFMFIIHIFFFSCDEEIERNNITDYGIVINEINYNSSDDFDPDDWVELYNHSNDTIDLSGWLFKDENNDHLYILPQGIIMPPDQYLVICKDIVKFTEVFTEVNVYHGDFMFGLGGGGDQIRLFDSSGLLSDRVEYNDDPPWPTIVDGQGPTLELRNPLLDNAKWQSWSASQGYGSPGEINSTYE
tara:strand:- start:957 stop:1541 length:585 start_codon:yes stop_codon:yes gene_type:complete